MDRKQIKLNEWKAKKGIQLKRKQESLKRKIKKTKGKSQAEKQKNQKTLGQ